MRLLLSIAIVAAATACSKRESATAANQPAAAAKTACAMLTAAEMSSIVGTTVSAEGDEGGGSTTCRYQPAGRSMPSIEVKIDWGGGSAAMMSTRILSRLEPGIADRLAGLGDEAAAMGPALWVRTGEDLVNLTLMGVDDDVAIAKRIVALLRPRMGPSATAKAANGGDSDATAKAGALVSGLLKGLADQNDQSKKDSAAGGAASSAASSTGSTAFADNATYGPATGAPIRVPLVAGLTLIGAEHEPRRGDYEPIVTITAVTDDTIATVMTANVPEGNRLAVNRTVRRDDFKQARGYRSWYETDDPLVFAGTTSFSLSTAVLEDLRTKGQSLIIRKNPDASPLAAIANLFSDKGDGADTAGHQGILKRVEPHAVAFPVLLNDEPVLLHAIHASGTFDDATIDFHVLDDPDNPILLRLAGRAVGRIVRITFPTPAAAPIEEKLKNKSRVELHGIYFDFGKATLRPESEPVLRQIAEAMTHNPAWKIGIEGHTDNVGGDAMNLDLSRRRAAAVKQALVDRYHVNAANLTTEGFGASRPADTNDTLSGRARNRRVELVRQ